MAARKLVPSYMLEARRERGRWVVEVPGAPGMHAASRSLADVEAIARDVLVRVLGLPADGFELVVVPAR